MFFSRTAAGEAMPIDFAPAADGNLILVDPEGRQVAELGPDDARAYQGVKYQTHFRSCPHAKGWRRSRGIPEPAPKEVQR